MTSNSRGGSRARNGGRGRNNNPEGRNQYSGAMSTARDNPFMTAAAVGGAVAAGVFLWSRRNQISDQIGNIAEQISEWREGTGSDNHLASGDGTSGGTSMPSARSRRRKRGPKQRSWKRR